MSNADFNLARRGADSTELREGLARSCGVGAECIPPPPHQVAGGALFYGDARKEDFIFFATAFTLL